MTKRRAVHLRRQYLYADEEYAAVFNCGECKKEIGVEEHDRNLLGPLVFCDTCDGKIMDQYTIDAVRGDCFAWRKEGDGPPPEMPYDW